MKELNIKVRVLETDRVGQVLSLYRNVLGRVFYIVGSGRDLLCLNRKQIKFITSFKN